MSKLRNRPFTTRAASRSWRSCAMSRSASGSSGSCANRASSCVRLSASLQAVREEEKARIARELHDELGQALTGLKMDLAQLVTQLTPEQLVALAAPNAMKSLIESTVARCAGSQPSCARSCSTISGLLPTIEWLVNDFSRRTGIAAGSDAARVPSSSWTPKLSTALVQGPAGIAHQRRTARGRQPRARRADRAPIAMRLAVHDNGKGFDACGRNRSARRSG